jgi:[FeFe] hydrogenase (group B1/B3)
MRGVFTTIKFLRNEIFKNISVAAYEGWSKEQIEAIPFQMIEEGKPLYRDTIEREREIIRARIKLAMNMELGTRFEASFIDEDLEALKTKKVGHDLISVIPMACEACAEKSFFVTNACRGCLAHPCVEVCPVKCVSMQNGQAFIDQEACVKCGRCDDVCPYGSIVKNERPCNAACGVNAFTKDDQERAVIITEKCVSCGMCMVSCPYGAIMDKSEIYQLVEAFKSPEEVCAIIAPAFVGQFGDKVSPEQVVEGLLSLGFDDVREVAYGADITTVDEARHFLKHVPVDQPFLATSCCPAWLKVAQKELGDKKYCVSDSSSPMVETANFLRKQFPKTRIVFVGPCSAKKFEAAYMDVHKNVDFVLTYEEINSMFIARGIELSKLTPTKTLNHASVDGRGFAISGGVLNAVENVIRRLDPDRVVKVERAETLSSCKKMLLLAKAGKKDGYLLEGMACPGGCVGGAGTIIHQTKAAANVTTFSRSSNKASALHTYEEFKKQD